MDIYQTGLIIMLATMRMMTMVIMMLVNLMTMMMRMRILIITGPIAG